MFLHSLISYPAERWREKLLCPSQLAQACLKEARTGGGSHRTPRSRGRGQSCSASPFVLWCLSLDFLLGCSPCWNVFSSLSLYLPFKPQASAALGQLPPFVYYWPQHAHLMRCHSNCTLYLFMCLSFPTTCRLIHLYFIPNRLFGF